MGPKVEQAESKSAEQNMTETTSQETNDKAPAVRRRRSERQMNRSVNNIENSNQEPVNLDCDLSGRQATETLISGAPIEIGKPISKKRGRPKKLDNKRIQDEMKDIFLKNPKTEDIQHAELGVTDPIVKKELHDGEDGTKTDVSTESQKIVDNRDLGLSSPLDLQRRSLNGSQVKLELDSLEDSGSNSSSLAQKVSTELKQVTGVVHSEHFQDLQSPASPPSADRLATNGDVELTDMEEVDRISSEDIEQKVSNPSIATSIEAQPYTIGKEDEPDDMQISDGLETDDEVVSDLQDCDMKKTVSLAKEAMHQTPNDSTFESRIPEWDNIEYNDYRIECKEKYFDDHCTCKSGPCFDKCLNWSSQVECGEYCKNIDCENNFFSKMSYKDVEVFDAGSKGFGVRANEQIKKGEFIMEYVGEVIGYDSVESRRIRYEKMGVKHYYMFEASNGVVIDSTRRGNMMRFVNHSCDPNAVSQDWIVRGRPTIGFFALKKIEAGDEITFDYNFMNNGVPQKCYCGASNCTGTIGKGKNIPAGPQAHRVEDSAGESSDEYESEDADSDDEYDKRRAVRNEQRRRIINDVMDEDDPVHCMDELVDILNDKAGCDFHLRWEFIDLLLRMQRRGDFVFINKFLEVEGLSKLANWLKRRYTSPRLGGVSIKDKIELASHIVGFIHLLPIYNIKQVSAYRLDDIIKEINNEKLESIRGAELIIVGDKLKNMIEQVSGSPITLPIWELHENLLLSASRLLTKWSFFGKSFKKKAVNERSPEPELNCRPLNRYQQVQTNEDRKRRGSYYTEEYYQQPRKRSCYDNELNRLYRPTRNYEDEFAHCRSFERFYNRRPDNQAYKPDALRPDKNLEAIRALKKLSGQNNHQSNNSEAILASVTPNNQARFYSCRLGTYGRQMFPMPYGNELLDLASAPPPPPPDPLLNTRKSLNGNSSETSPRKRLSRFANQPLDGKSIKIHEVGFCPAPVIRRYDKLSYSPFLRQPEGVSSTLIRKEMAIELVRYYARKFRDACEEMGMTDDNYIAELTDRVWCSDEEYRRDFEENAEQVPASIFIEKEENSVKQEVIEEVGTPTNSQRKLTTAERLALLNLMPDEIPTTTGLAATKVEVDEQAKAEISQPINKPHTPTEPRPPSALTPLEKIWKTIQLPPPNKPDRYYYNKKTQEVTWDLPEGEDVEPPDPETDQQALQYVQNSETIEEQSSRVTFNKRNPSSGQHRVHKEKKFSRPNGTSLSPAATNTSFAQQESNGEHQLCDVSSSNEQTEIKRKFRTRIQKIFQEYLYPYKKALGDHQFLYHARTMNKIFTKKHEQDYPERFEYTPEVHEIAKKYAKEYLKSHNLLKK